MYRFQTSPLSRLTLLCLLALQLVACGDLKQALYDVAIDSERSRAGLSTHELAMDGMQIAYLENDAGPDKPTLVFVHGFGGNKDNWLRISRYLQDQYHILAVDLPGHGDSSKDLNRRYDLDDQVLYLHDILAQLKIEHFHLSGNSMGGAIASLYAATYPQQVQSLVLFDPAGIYDHVSDMAKELEKGVNPLIARNAEEYDRLLDFVMVEKPFIPWPIKSVLADMAVRNQPINDKIFSDLRGEVNGHNYDFKQALTQIQAPTLIVWGKQDRVIAVGNAEVFDQLIPKSQMLLLDNVGHLPMVEVPEYSASTLQQFTHGEQLAGR